MRFIYFFFFFAFGIYASAFNISVNVEKALGAMQSGDIQNSVQQLNRSAMMNDVIAQFYMGQCYEYGIGVEANPQMAFNMYRRAAERGLPQAMLSLIRCYETGIGVPSNKLRAQELQARYDKKHTQIYIPDFVEIYNKAASEDYYTVAENVNPTNEVEKWTEKPSQQPRISKNTTPPDYASNIQKQPIEKPDVDIDIPRIGKENENIFALVIANEEYQDVAQVPNAINDGEIFAEYCEKTLGLPSQNIHLIKNATLNNIRRELNLAKEIAEAYDGNISFIIYYAGHGIPDEKTRNAYLIPIDGFVADLSTCISMNDFYETLGNMASAKTIVFLDACFSGSLRGDGMLASARGVAIKPKTGTVSGNTVVISATQGDETAYPYNEKKHGLFTYYILKKLKESQGDVSLGELADYIKDNVMKKSLIVNGKRQTPSVNFSQNIIDSWQAWKIN